MEAFITGAPRPCIRGTYARGILTSQRLITTIIMTLRVSRTLQAAAQHHGPGHEGFAYHADINIAYRFRNDNRIVGEKTEKLTWIEYDKEGQDDDDDNTEKSRDKSRPEGVIGFFLTRISHDYGVGHIKGKKWAGRKIADSMPLVKAASVSTL